MESYGRERRVLEVIAGVLIAIFLIQDFAESRTKSATSDEPPHMASGLSYLETGKFLANPQHPPLIKELAGLSLILGGIHWPGTAATARLMNHPEGVQPEWEIGYGIMAANGPDRVMAWARAPMMLVGALLCAMVFLLGRQIAGGWAAVGAVFLCAMDPTILGHSYLVTTDIGVTAFFLVFLFALWEYIERPSRLGMMWCGAALGLTMCAKFSGILALPVGGVL